MTSTSNTSTSRISADQDLITLINIFTVTADTQQQLVDILVEATDEVMCTRPGFISANIHASVDGTRVTNYAQWRSEDDFQAMLKDPTAREHMTACSQVAVSFEPHLYRVAAVHTAP